ncbi:man(5)GlcNAc(2)-PP-dolichol translocation protein RFT1-like [Dendrobates tinctorius]|uniref:man(5)GlcNAc(2)-PP-dolichol translocation protein RFT1-like n=1 Tax=Dendrobates tinctorius TaxID=92724 RepID=UPI003CC9AD6B
MAAQHDVLRDTTRLASSTMVLQVVFRLLTFALSAFTLRYVSREVIGVVNVRVPLGICWSVILGGIWLSMLEVPDPAIIPHYGTGVLAFGFSAVIELMSEPFWVLAQAHLFVRLKVIAESLAIIVRCSVTVTLVLLRPQWGLLIFALAQVLYTSLLSLCYIVYFAKFLCSQKKSFPLHSMMEFLPRRSVSQDFLDWKQAWLAWSFFKQSFLK